MASFGFVQRTITNPAEGVAGTVPVLTSAANILVYSPVRPVRIVRWGVILTTVPTVNQLQLQGNVSAQPNGAGAVTTGSTANVQIASGYNSSNSPALFVDTAGGTLTVPTTAFASLAIGSVLWHNVNMQAAQAGGYYPAPETALIPPGGVSTQLVIYPGQSFAIKVAGTPPSAGAGIPFLLVEEQAWVADFNNNAMVVSGYPNTNGTVPTPSWPFPVTPFNAQS